jgi:hypothetical protein
MFSLLDFLGFFSCGQRFSSEPPEESIAGTIAAGAAHQENR